MIACGPLPILDGNIAHRYSPNMRMENRLYNQLTAIIIPRELGKILILVLGQTLPDFLVRDYSKLILNFLIHKVISVLHNLCEHHI
jgi:hypothetical protein